MLRTARLATAVVLLGLAALILAACEQPAPPLLDARGRTLVLHGVNLSQHAKGAAGHTSWHTYEDYARLRDWGLHAVRLLVFWEAIEPQPGVYDEEYLERVRERVRWAGELGLVVLVDLHQDVYSARYGGDGAPDWACLDEGEPFEPVEPWWMRNFQPAVRTAWKNFWEGDTLQDHYVEAFSRLAEALAGEPAVLGYDLMNEPFGAYQPAEFETHWLARFYRRLGDRLVAVDPDARLFYEPLVALNPGLASQAGPLPFAGAVYAPHYYHVQVHEGQPYDGNTNSMRWTIDLRRRESARWQQPLVFGEIGVIAGVQGAEQYMRDLLGLLDERKLGWFYWSYDRGSERGFNLLDPDGNEYPVTDVLVRTYPLRTAGELLRFGTDPATGVFELVFRQRDGVSGPTEIAVPSRRWPQGFTVQSSDPPGSWSSTHDAARQLVVLEADPGSSLHTVRLVPNP